MSEKWNQWNKNTPPVEGAFATSRGWEIPLKGTDPSDNLTEVIVADRNLMVEAGTADVASINLPDDGTDIDTGGTVTVEVLFNERVDVDTASGTPSIPLFANDGTTPLGDATYTSGTGTNKLVFEYTVQVGDDEATGIAVGADIALNSGTIQDADDNNATVTFTQVTSTLTVNQT